MTDSFGAGQDDVYLIKTDENGNEEWYKTFGGTFLEWGFSVQQTYDGGYIIVGVTHSFGTEEGDVYLIKTDEKGNEEWNRTFGGLNRDGGTSVQQISDGGYIIAGYTDSYGAGGHDVWLIKVNGEPTPALIPTATLTPTPIVTSIPTPTVTASPTPLVTPTLTPTALTPEEGIPGFEAAIAIAGLLTMAYIFRRRK